MTANQIAYHRLREDQRSHRANERIAGRQAATAETQASVAATAAAENARANRERERVNWWSAQRSADNQSTANAINWWAVRENQRHAQAVEAETLRANQMQERLKAYDIASNQQYRAGSLAVLGRQASVAERQATVAERNAAVNERQASVSESQLSVARSNLAESIRSHQAQELISYANLGELARSNREREAINWASNAEQQRAHMAAEEQTAYRDSVNARNLRRQQEIAQQQADTAQQRAETEQYRAENQARDLRSQAIYRGRASQQEDERIRIAGIQTNQRGFEALSGSAKWLLPLMGVY